jgi:hypothetical protein
MPAYQSPLTGEKRKLPLDTSSRKKVAIENSLGGPSAHRESSYHGGEEYWMIQWYVRVSMRVLRAHLKVLGDTPSTRNTKLGMGTLSWFSQALEGQCST